MSSQPTSTLYLRKRATATTTSSVTDALATAQKA